MYPYYRAGLCLCGVFRLCLLWPVAIAALWSAGGDICGVYGIYSVDILTVGCASKHNDKLMSYYSGLSGAVHFGTLVFKRFALVYYRVFLYPFTWQRFQRSKILWNCNGRGVHINFRSTGGAAETAIKFLLTTLALKRFLLAKIDDKFGARKV